MTEKTAVTIIGAGPAGTLLSLILQRHGIDSVVLERRDRSYVLGRIRAGILEATSLAVLEKAGLADRLHNEAHFHHSVKLGWAGSEVLEVDFVARTGKQMMAYGQGKVQEDLYAAVDERNADVRFECENVEIHDAKSDSPWVTYTKNGESHRIDCDIVAGCDGFHGVSRSTIPDDILSVYEKAYPFGWLGVLSETPPLPVLIYANHERGFALCSERNPMLSRFYVQCPAEDEVADWSDDRFWSELVARVPKSEADHIVPGPIVEKSIAPLRSFVVEPMQWGRLFLAGDAAHIVPPTGAKGLNLAISDIHYLSEAIVGHYAGVPDSLEGYSPAALARVWSSVRFSWWLTMLLHRFPGQSEFEQRAQEQDLLYLASSPAAQESLAEQYVGLDL